MRQKLVEGLHYSSTGRQEASIKVNKANEFPEFALGGRLWKCTNGVNFIFHGLNAFAAGQVAKKVKGWSSKNQFAEINGKAMALKMF